jgi:ABC-2 type transport system ATP-binding protein
VSQERVPVARGLLEEIEGLREIRQDEAGLTLFVDDGTRAVAQVVRALDTAGLEMGAVALSRPSLDEVFLRATGSRLEGAESTSEGSNGTD